MLTPYRIYDNEEEKFIWWSFRTLAGAEDYIEACLNGDYERYVIYERLT